MFITAAFLSLLTYYIRPGNAVRTCVPNSQFYANGKICQCDNFGQWHEDNCNVMTNTQTCPFGQVIWRGCHRCTCQKNGKFACSNSNCPETTPNSKIPSNQRQGSTAIQNMISLVGPRCTPFKSYIVDCYICTCPASGWSVEIRCSADASCPSRKSLSSIDLRDPDNKHACIPNVVYFFTCLNCVCTDEGFFVLEKCVETCKPQNQNALKCKPKKFFKKDCNVCFCPENGVPDNKICTDANCKEFKPQLKKYSSVVNMKCDSHKFTKPKCLYCECNSNGLVNEDTCLELRCLEAIETKYIVAGNTCSAGEITPICIECFCFANGQTQHSHCTKSCSQQSKVIVLENILTDHHYNLIDLTKIPNTCQENSVNVDRGRLCLCLNPNTKICTSQTINLNVSKRYGGPDHGSVKKNITINFNATCEPSTFVEFDCNTCFCSKNGTIDPRWCTYDDCEGKKLTRTLTEHGKEKDICMPGHILQVECNFCICPDSRISKEKKCTTYQCTKQYVTEEFSCEPLTYYEVDCNVCYCPRDGLKNVEKCTKNICEKHFLRSDVCVPGQLFSEACNVCVCPPDGVKTDKACTNHSCPELAFRKIFDVENLQDNVIKEESKSLGHCFPGEEFEVGCKLCICPDMGLRVFASCVPDECSEEQGIERKEHRRNRRQTITISTTERNDGGEEEKLSFPRFPHFRRSVKRCTVYNFALSSERKDCTPGTMYIIRCRQCICPYMGNINYFCRPLPKGTYCEQAYPNYNYVPMGRRTHTVNTMNHNSTQLAIESPPITLFNATIIDHFHTMYNCTKPGHVVDNCYICECEEVDGVLVEEHCFKSDAIECEKVEKPTFLEAEPDKNEHKNVL